MGFRIRHFHKCIYFSDSLCTGKPEGAFVNHPDCKKFIQCFGGKALVFTCAPGTSWNEDKLTCDIKSADCQ